MGGRIVGSAVWIVQDRIAASTDSRTGFTKVSLTSAMPVAQGNRAGAAANLWNAAFRNAEGKECVRHWFGRLSARGARCA